MRGNRGVAHTRRFAPHRGVPRGTAGCRHVGTQAWDGGAILSRIPRQAAHGRPRRAGTSHPMPVSDMCSTMLARPTELLPYSDYSVCVLAPHPQPLAFSPIPLAVISYRACPHVGGCAQLSLQALRTQT